MARLPFLFLLLPLILNQPAHGAGVYKWTDKDGNVHFTDKPPPKDQASNVEQPDTTLRNVDQGYPSVDAGVTINLSDRNETRKQQREAALQRRNTECQETRERLELIAGRVEYFDDSGERIVRTERYRQQEEAELRQFLTKNCGTP